MQPNKRELLSPSNAAMLLIDHQDGILGWVKYPENIDVVKNNAVVLAKAANLVNIPTVLTTSMEDMPQGPLMKEIQEQLPQEYEARAKRDGIVDALTDQNFAGAVEATGRKKLIIAGVTTEVCVMYPAITAAQNGYEVHVVMDACGSTSQMSSDMAFRRMEKEGVYLCTTLQLIAELAKDWVSEDGKVLNELLFTDVFCNL